MHGRSQRGHSALPVRILSLPHLEARVRNLGSSANRVLALTDDKGASIRITDFAPRFREYDRIFRPLN
jgi:hypothetical protein